MLLFWCADLLLVLLNVQRNCVFARTKPDLTSDQIEEEDTKDEVKARKADQRKDRVAVAQHFAVAVTRAKQTVGQPWLASQLGRHPTQSVRDVRKWKCQHQDPKEPRSRLKPSTPVLKLGVSHKQNENRTERNHHVKRIVQKLDVIGPRISRIFVQPMNITLKSAVGEKTQGSWNLNGVVQTPGGDIRLANG